MPRRYQLQFPPEQEHQLKQNEVYFYLVENGKSEKILFHEYDKIFKKPGLYEQLFYERLKCTSPKTVTALLQRSVASEHCNWSELRVLDLGAGNGMMAECLRGLGVARIVGVDIIPEAKEASLRERPTVYDDYIVADFTSLSRAENDKLRSWNFDCLTTVAALGFGDIPPRAFFEALRFLPKDGWVAFNIKDTFLEHSDESGFSALVRELIFSEFLAIYQIERYTHRLSIEGVPLKYFALVGRITTPIPDDFLTARNIH